MARIMVLGAGIGGLPAAYELRKSLDKSHDIVVVNPVDSFHFTPSNPWVAVGWRRPEQIVVPLKKPLERKRIRLVVGAARAVKPEARVVELTDGQRLEYDYLLIATGPKLAFDEVPGLGPEGGYTQSVCTLEHAKNARLAYEEFLQNPGPIVVGAVQGASCFGPAYEFAMILDKDLRRRKLRHKVPMTFITSEPYIGHLGLGGVGDSKGMLESIMRARHIKWIINAKVREVTRGRLTAVEHDNDGKPVREQQLPFSFGMLLPAFKGVDAVMGVDGLVNPRGFVTIDALQRNARYPNVYSAGVCVAIAPPEPTPVPTGVPKTGYMIESMVSAVVANIKADIEGKPARATATWNAVCLADMGDSGIAFVALPQIPPRNVTWTKAGYWVHLAKIAYEKYFLRKMRKGSNETFYERYMLKLLGIMRLAG
ncbi:MAG: FAD-dependent oxidoreductase [Gammaproteobacteria bacterium]|nr:FAD-dependent oxidoreductase [Gammaproteobacteria bacterium]